MSGNYIPLYRKYRPQTLETLVGQEHIKKTLTSAIELGRISHAYLFTGPRGTGKTSTARILAKSLNCQNGPTTKPCGECQSCRDITNSIPIDVIEEHIDMLSASGHKLNGPKGIGFLYIRKGLKLRSLIHGGGQERKRRAGTENVPGIVGFGKAVEIAMANMEEKQQKERELRDYLITRVLAEIPYTRLNGHRTKRLPNNSNFSFQFIEGESLLIMLDMKGICASSGSACTSSPRS